MSKSKKLVVDASAVLAVILEEPEKIGLISATAGKTLPSACMHTLGSGQRILGNAKAKEADFRISVQRNFDL